MPLESPIRLRTPFAAGLDLPPPFRSVALRESGDALRYAVGIAAEHGAGTLVHVGRSDLAEFAVVLEPDEPLRTARRTFYAGLAALADTLAAHVPPEKPMAIIWPGAIMVGGGLIGGGRLAWPANADEDTAPAWLVFAAMIRTAAVGEREPKLHPLTTALEDEGFLDLGPGRLIESFARHLMAVIDAWQQDGFAGVARSYLSRLGAEQGVRRDIDDNGDVLLRRPGTAGVERRPLIPALAQPSWLDPATAGPRR